MRKGQLGSGVEASVAQKLCFLVLLKTMSETARRRNSVLWDKIAEGHLLHKRPDGDHGVLCLVLLSQVSGHWASSSSAKGSMQ